MQLRTRALVLVTVLLAVGTAGCIGDSNPEENVSAAENVPDDRSTANRTVIEEVPLEKEASFPLYTIDVDVVGVTLSLNDQGHEVFEAPIEDTLQAANLTLTWEPVTPVMEELGLALAWGCGDEQCESKRTTGQSPLGLGVDDIRETEEAFVVVFATRDGTGEANARLSHTQGFQVEGTFATAVPAQQG